MSWVSFKEYPSPQRPQLKLFVIHVLNVLFVGGWAGLTPSPLSAGPLSQLSGPLSGGLGGPLSGGLNGQLSGGLNGPLSAGLGGGGSGGSPYSGINGISAGLGGVSISGNNSSFLH